MTCDTHHRFDIAFTVSPPEFLGSLSLLLQVEISMGIGWKRHQTTLHSIPVSALPDGRQSVFILDCQLRKSRWALPFPRTGCTLDVHPGVYVKSRNVSFSLSLDSKRGR